MSKRSQRAQSAYAAGYQLGREMYETNGEVKPKQFNAVYRCEINNIKVNLPSIHYLGCRNGYINTRARAVTAQTNLQLDAKATGAK